MPSVQKKICLLGDFAVGKTSLIRRFTEGIFEDRYLSTIGTKISRKVLSVQDTTITLLIWDLAGGEKFSRVMNSYYRGASGAILVCDLTRKETLSILVRYAEDFWSLNPQTPLVVVGNKVDLVEQRAISTPELTAVAAQLGMVCYTSSAKTGENVETLFQTLGQRMLEP